MKRTRAPSADGSDLPNEVNTSLRKGDKGETDVAQTVAAGQLRAFIERVESLIEDKQAIQGDISDVFAKMKGTGFDTTAVRAIIKLRKQDAAERQEREAILDLYKSALGME